MISLHESVYCNEIDYVKDSLLNTNSDFDFGEFTELPDTIANTGAEAFVFTFT